MSNRSLLSPGSRPAARSCWTLLILITLLAVIGCGGKTGSSDDPDRLEIAVIPKGTTHHFWKNIHAGAAKAASELDVDIVWQGPHKEDDRPLQIQVVQNFISRGIDAIVLAPLDSRSLSRPVEAAAARGIPVVIIDSGLESDAYSSYIASDNYLGGRLAALLMTDLLQGRGDIVMLRFQEGSASTTAREAGFLDGLAELAPQIRILSNNQYAGATLEKGLQASQNLLNRFPQIDGIFTPNETSTQGMLRALQTANRIDEVKLIGFDANTTLIEALRSGQLQGVVVQDPFDMGYRGVLTAASVVRGEPYDSLFHSRVMMITAENMDTEDARQLLSPDLSWLEEE